MSVRLPSRWLAVFASACAASLLAIGWTLSDRRAMPDGSAVAEASERRSPALALPREDLVELPASAPASLESARRVERKPGEVEIEVLVRREDDQTPIPDCDVILLSDPDSHEDFWRFVTEHGFDPQALRAAGLSSTTDASGRTRVICVPGESFLYAISRTHSGGVNIKVGVDATPVTIDCHAVDFVQVRVVDVDGRPRSGIPLMASPVKRGSFRPLSPAAISQEPDGIAWLGPLEEGRGEWLLRLRGVFPRSTAISFRNDPPPSELITLVLPPHGALEVHLVDGAKRAFPARAALTHLDAVGVELAPDPREPLAFAAGRARIERVGLGLDLVALIEIEGIKGRATAAGRGPVAAGETAVLELDVSAAQPYLLGRALLAAGGSASSRDLEVRLKLEGSDGTREIQRSAHTDDDGRFAIFVDALGNADWRGTCLVREQASGLGDVRSFELPAGSNALGTWTLGRPDLIASGTVLDDQGKPMPGVELRLADPEGAVAIASALKIETDSTGRFELRGWCTEPSVEVEFRLLGSRLLIPGEVACGSKNVEFRLP